MKRFAVPLIVFAGLLVLLAVGLNLDPRRVPSPLIGKPAPPFAASTLHDPSRQLSLADLHGKVALVNVWASWCASCRQEHPYVKELARRGVPVYGIDYKDSRGDAVDWLNTFGNAYVATAFDPRGRIGLDWGVYGVPETFVLDANGVVRHKHIGAMDDRSLEDEILPLVRRLRQEASK